MRYLDTMPAWAARQRSRRLVRHSDEKVVRWINRNHAKVEAPDSSARDEASSNDNVAGFAQGRSVQAS